MHGVVFGEKQTHEIALPKVGMNKYVEIGYSGILKPLETKKNIKKKHLDALLLDGAIVNLFIGQDGCENRNKSLLDQIYIEYISD